MNTYTIGYGFTGVNIVTDVVVLLLPVPSLSKLQMSMSKKLNIIGIFILGGLWVLSIAPQLAFFLLTTHPNSVCMSAVVRIPFIRQYSPVDPTCICSRSHSLKLQLS